MEDLNPDSRQVLFDLLAHCRENYDVKYEENKFNHVPMNLIELYLMGASPNRLREFYESHSKKLDTKLPGTGAISKSNFKDMLGKRTFYIDYRDFFEKELDIKRKSYSEKWNGKIARGLIADFLPKLLEGIAGDSFHAVMILGYALELDNEDLALDGLAFLCYSYKSLGHLDSLKRFTHPPANTRLADDFVEVLKDVALNHPRFNIEGEAELDSQDARLDHFLAKEGDFLYQRHLLPRITSDLQHQNSFEAVVNRVIDIFSYLFTSTQNQNFLHVAAGGIALRQLMMSVLNHQDQLFAAHYFVRGALAMFIINEQPALLVVDPNQFSDELKRVVWNEITSKAIQCDSEHAIKFAYVFWREDEHRFNPIHKVIAGHFVGLVCKKSTQFAKKSKIPIENLANQPSYARAVMTQPAPQQAAPKEKVQPQQIPKQEVFKETKVEQAKPVAQHESYAAALVDNLSPAQQQAAKELADRLAEQRGEPIPSPIKHKLEKQGKEKIVEKRIVKEEHKRHEESPYLEPSEEELPHKKARTPQPITTEQIKETARQVVDRAQDVADMSRQKVSDTTQRLKTETVPRAMEKSREIISEGAQRAQDLSQDLKKTVSDSAQRAISMGQEAAAKSRDVVMESKDKLTQKAQELLNKTQSLAGEARGVVKDKSQQIQSTASNVMGRTRGYVKETASQAVDRASGLADQSLERVGLPPQEFKPKVKHLGFTVMDIFRNLFAWGTIFYLMLLPFKIYYNMVMIPFRAFNVLLLRPLRTQAVPAIKHKAAEVPRVVNNIRMHEARLQVRDMAEHVKAQQKQELRQRKQEPVFIFSETIRADVKVDNKQQEADTEKILRNISELQQKVDQLQTRIPSSIQG